MEIRIFKKNDVTIINFFLLIGYGDDGRVEFMYEYNRLSKQIKIPNYSEMKKYSNKEEISSYSFLFVSKFEKIIKDIVTAAERIRSSEKAFEYIKNHMTCIIEYFKEISDFEE